MYLLEGKLLLHKHPVHASSWSEECILRMCRQGGVSTIIMGLCRFGQAETDGRSANRQGGISNCSDILERSERRCSGKCATPRRRGSRRSACALPNEREMTERETRRPICPMLLSSSTGRRCVHAADGLGAMRARAATERVLLPSASADRSVDDRVHAVRSVGC